MVLDKLASFANLKTLLTYFQDIHTSTDYQILIQTRLILEFMGHPNTIYSREFVFDGRRLSFGSRVKLYFLNKFQEYILKNNYAFVLINDKLCEEIIRVSVFTFSKFLIYLINNLKSLKNI